MYLYVAKENILLMGSDTKAHKKYLSLYQIAFNTSW